MVRRLQVKTPLPNSIKTPLLEGKSRVLLEFYSSFTRVSVCWVWTHSFQSKNNKYFVWEYLTVSLGNSFFCVIIGLEIAGLGNI